MSVIRRESYLYGIRYWASWSPNMKPRYQIFEYVGHDTATGIYYFQSRQNKALIGKNFNQLIQGTVNNYFKPFLLDFERILVHNGMEFI